MIIQRTDGKSFHFTDHRKGLWFAQSATASQSLQDSVQRQEVRLDLLLCHLLQKILQNRHRLMQKLLQTAASQQNLYHIPLSAPIFHCISLLLLGRLWSGHWRCAHQLEKQNIAIQLWKFRKFSLILIDSKNCEAHTHLSVGCSAGQCRCWML